MIARYPIACRPQRPRSLFLHAAYYFFLAVGVLGLGYVTYVVVDAQAFEAIEEFKLPKMRPAPGPRSVAVAEGEVIGEMIIPRLDLKTIVVQGDSNKILRRSVGHLPLSPLPGEPGNVALAGNRDGFLSPRAFHPDRERGHPVDQDLAHRRLGVELGLEVGVAELNLADVLLGQDDPGAGQAMLETIHA